MIMMNFEFLYRNYTSFARWSWFDEPAQGAGLTNVRRALI